MLSSYYCQNVLFVSHTFLFQMSVIVGNLRIVNATLFNPWWVDHSHSTAHAREYLIPVNSSSDTFIQFLGLVSSISSIHVL